MSTYYGYDHGEDALIEKEDREDRRAERRARWKRRKAWLCWMRRAWFLAQGLYLFDGHRYDPKRKDGQAAECMTCGQQ